MIYLENEKKTRLEPTKTMVEIPRTSHDDQPGIKILANSGIRTRAVGSDKSSIET